MSIHDTSAANSKHQVDAFFGGPLVVQFMRFLVYGLAFVVFFSCFSLLGASASSKFEAYKRTRLRRMNIIKAEEYISVFGREIRQELGPFIQLFSTSEPYSDYNRHMKCVYNYLQLDKQSIEVKYVQEHLKNALAAGDVISKYLSQNEISEILVTIDKLTPQFMIELVRLYEHLKPHLEV